MYLLNPCNKVFNCEFIEQRSKYMDIHLYVLVWDQLKIELTVLQIGRVRKQKSLGASLIQVWHYVEGTTTFLIIDIQFRNPMYRKIDACPTWHVSSTSSGWDDMYTVLTHCDYKGHERKRKCVDRKFNLLVC
jgi:hypothetical protein